jgi:hypothetical protein
MALSTNPNALKKVLNNLNSNQDLPGNLNALDFGDILRGLRTTLRAKTVLGTGINPYVAAAAQSIALPEGAKANSVITAYARAGGGTLGPLVVDAPDGLTAAAGHIGVSPNGDLLFAAADAWTSVDVVYEPEKADVIEIVVPVIPGTGIGLLPQSLASVKAGVVSLLEAESLAGALVSKMHVVAPANGAPATTLVNLDLAKLNVRFAVADAVTSARLKLSVTCAVDVDALLEAASTSIG